MIKYLGTHNSGTSSKLVWWQRPLGFVLHATSRCQTLSIEEQLKMNVRLFNLQITYYKKQWIFSHGLCIYTDKFYDAINTMVKYATKESPVYFQLFLDKNFLLGQNETEFRKLVDDLVDELKGTNVYMRYAYIEGKKEYPYNDTSININTSEHYWTQSWAKNNARNWVDKLPLPKRHAKEFNQKYIDENKADYLMLDFIEYGNYPEVVKSTTTEVINFTDLVIGNTSYTNTSYTTTNTTSYTSKPVVEVNFNSFNTGYNTSYVNVSYNTSYTNEINFNSFSTSYTPTHYPVVCEILGTNVVKDYQSFNVVYPIRQYNEIIVQITPQVGYYLPSEVTVYGAQIKSWNQYTGKLVLFNIAIDGAYAFHPQVIVDCIDINTSYTSYVYPEMIFKSKDGRRKDNVLIKAYSDMEILKISYLPTKTSFNIQTHLPNEKFFFNCDNNGELYYRNDIQLKATKMNEKVFTRDELNGLVVIYKDINTSYNTTYMTSYTSYIR